MQCHFLLLICLGVATADKWPNLKTTFGINPLGVAFEAQPRTQADAVSYGYSPISSDTACAGKHLGFAYADPAEPSITFLYDEAGYIAGVQSVILKSAVDVSFWDPETIPAYVSGTFFDQEAWLTTAYFVDPALICAGGRTQDQWNKQGTGDRIWVQVGETPDNFVKIPLSKSEADGTSNWNEHLCFPGMGTHYMEFDYSHDQNCDSVFPVQILYDHGVIKGFVWQHYANLPGKRWEHPDKNAANMIIDSAPDCTLNMIDTPGLSTLHHYFVDHPLYIQCIF